MPVMVAMVLLVVLVLPVLLVLPMLLVPVQVLLMVLLLVVLQVQVLLLLVLCAIDWALYSVFDTIRQHSFVQYSFRSEPGPRAWGQPPPASHTSSFLFCILSLCPL